MDLIDTHCHFNFEDYNADRDQVWADSHAVGVRRMIIPAVDIQTAHEAIALAEKYEGIYVAVGIHPNSTAEFDEDVIPAIRELAPHPKVISIGEIGLDYYRYKSPKSQQFRAFEAQLALARELELPVIIHNREASEDTLTILEKWAKDLPDTLQNRAGVLHSFSGDVTIAKRALDIGFYLGFTGPITYKNADDMRRVAIITPLNRILVETDAPFLTPIPHRGKRNTPAYIPIMVDRLASLHNIPTEEMGRYTTENAVNLFKL
ncbi:MAG: TatD family hydrolase [Anaerolineae bacterium]|nr:TatD family hydrolase [Anaerolineae bacterium]